MNMRLRLPMALALALGTSHAYALGLGQIEVKSTLNQPLVAEIPVLLNSPGEADRLAVRLASPDAFARIGLDRPTLQAANLSFEVQTDARGRKVIRVTTPNTVSDPFLSFLLEVDWGNGRMLREYTVLLDPPSMAPVSASAPAVARPAPEPVAARAEPLLETPPPMPEPAPAPVPAPAPEPVAAVPVEPSHVPPAQQESYPAYGTDTYAVGAGDTLWSIAQRSRPDESVTINQMMMALLRANPEAFVGNNINRLKKGAVLRIPGRDETTVLVAAEAAAQVREQMQGWGGPVATVAQPADASGTAPASTRPAGRTASDSRLELTPPRGQGSASASQSGAAADGTGRELRAELARSREEASALAQENVELKSRVGELEELQSDTRRLIELKDSELAAAQRRLAELEAAASAVAPPVETPVVEAPVASVETPAQTPADATTDTAASDAGMVDADAAPSADSADAVSEPIALSEPAPAPVAEPEPVAPAPVQQEAPAQPAAGFNPWIVGGGAAVLLGLIGLLLARRKKKPAVAAPAAAAAPAVVAETYEDANQEEGELIEALSQYPNDLQLHLDLLHHYFARNDAGGFEMAAEAMYAQVYDAQDPAWQEALSLGRQIAPDHPLFAGTVAVQGDAHARNDDAFQSDAVAQAEQPAQEREIDWFGNATSTPAPASVPAPQIVPEPVAMDAFDEEPVAFETAFVDAPVDGGGVDVDAAATKLELARAYMDMGDSEGARGMLEEVLTEGDAAQRNEARQLLDGIF